MLTTDNDFTWIPFFKELAARLLPWQNRQRELLDFLDSLRSSDLKVTPLIDENSQGERMPFTELDPFTFIGTINRGIAFHQRQAIATAMKGYFDIGAAVPSDFNGVPTLNNMRSHFLLRSNDRQPGDAEDFWNLFALAQQENPLDQDSFLAALDKVLAKRIININITMALFWIRPDTFLSLDQHMRKRLGIKLPADGLTAGFYRDAIKGVQSRYPGKSMADVSHEVWLEASSQADSNSDLPDRRAPAEILDPTVDYYFVGAFWHDFDQPDQTERFVDEGIWINGHEDKLLDVVKSIKVGDRIAIKSVSTQKRDLPFDARGNTVSKMTIKAIGTVVGNEGDGRQLAVEWEEEFEPRDWYFFTYRGTIWKIRTDSGYQHLELSRKLLDFTFNDGEQDLDWFINYWYGPEPKPEEVPVPYSPDDVIADGAFMSIEEVDQILNRAEHKKAVILQGPPGVGKTFLARRLAYALMEEKAPDRVRMVQFHQSYAYEDFIRGYRPSPEQGGFNLQDGLFLAFCEQAAQDSDNKYVFIIDEINRGNLSQIFGEVLMLIEHDKRGPNYAVPLLYQRAEEPEFYVPDNLYLIGLMNVADRSLAMIDYALRRRFSFQNLTPKFTAPTYAHWLKERGMDDELIELIISRMDELNTAISEDPLLGPNYQVGHSFFTPRGDDFSQLTENWFRTIVRSEVGPLLREYWYDNPTKAEEHISRLLR